MGHVFPPRPFGQPNPNTAALTCSAKAAQRNFSTGWETETQVLSNTSHILPSPLVPPPKRQHSSKTAYSLHSSIMHLLFFFICPKLIATTEVSLTSFLGETANNHLLVTLSTLSYDFRGLCISSLCLFFPHLETLNLFKFAFPGKSGGFCCLRE